METIINIEALRCAIQREYSEVAAEAGKGFHFHTGLKLARILKYSKEWIERAPAEALESFAGTGNPFLAGPIGHGEKIVDAGCGSGFDSTLAATFTGEKGAVIGVDMTPEMLAKARRAVSGAANFSHIEFRSGYLEELPVKDGWADMILSNGVLNLCPSKMRVLQEFHRVLSPGGRLQIGDILVEKPVSEKAKQNIDLWTG